MAGSSLSSAVPDTNIGLAFRNNLKTGGEKKKEGSEESFEIVEFLLGQDHFAINLFDVREVVEYSRITTLPNSPPYIKGIIDLRGEITTIVDLKMQLAISGGAAVSEEKSRIIVLDDRLTHSKVGIMVDDVLTVSEYTRSQVDSTATSGEEDSYIVGIIKKKVREREKDTTHLIIWLDVHRLIGIIEKR